MTAREERPPRKGRPAASVADPPVRRGRRGGRARRNRVLVQTACVAISLFMVAPMYLITLAAFSSPESLNEYPRSFLPTDVSTETMEAFLTSTGVIPALLNSLLVGLFTVLLSLALGVPAGYALARFAFPGRDSYQLFLLFTRALPIVVLSVPLARLFITTGVSDTILAVTLLHTALALPTTVLITASIIVSVPRDVEEAALVFGCTPLQAFRQVVAPLALPGTAAAAVFTFVLSWNEILGAAVLTLTHRTLPAQVLGSLQWSPLAYRFAGGFALVVPALLFIFVMRRYLLNMWGTTLR